MLKKTNLRGDRDTGVLCFAAKCCTEFATVGANNRTKLNDSK